MAEKFYVGRGRELAAPVLVPKVKAYLVTTVFCFISHPRDSTVQIITLSTIYLPLRPSHHANTPFSNTTHSAAWARALHAMSDLGCPEYLAVMLVAGLLIVASKSRFVAGFRVWEGTKAVHIR